MDQRQVLRQIQGRLIVSCQALPDEPLHSPFIMGRMALAACEGGAAGIRANTVEDIREIRRNVDLPVIGIIKRIYEDAPEVYITPTAGEIDALAQEHVEIIALDATRRPRPGGRTLADVFLPAREQYPRQLFMADCSDIEEGLEAARMGFDLIGTTLAGYTCYTKGSEIPPFGMIETLAKMCGRPVIAEGNLSTPQELRRALDAGAFAAVVGSAITRPREITRRFAAALG